MITLKFLGYNYSLYNVGKSGRQRRNNKRKGKHIIRNILKRELQKEIKELGLNT